MEFSNIRSSILDKYKFTMAFNQPKTAAISSFLLFVFAGCALTFPHPETFIFGGNKATRNQFPFLVSLQVKIDGKYQHNCGASILPDSKFSSRFLVTAAHCWLLGAEVKDYQIAVGILMKNETGVRYNVSKFIIHPDHIPLPIQKITHDIAVLVLDKAIPLDKNTKTIELNPNFIGDDVKATFVGWGDSLDHYEGLKYIALTTYPTKKCSELLPRGLVKEEMICAYSGIFGKGVCQGDSGGPLILDNKIIAVNSWAKACGIGYPDGFTRVSPYIKWIEQVMKQEAEHF